MRLIREETNPKILPNMELGIRKLLSSRRGDKDVFLTSLLDDPEIQ